MFSAAPPPRPLTRFPKRSLYDGVDVVAVLAPAVPGNSTLAFAATPRSPLLFFFLTGTKDDDELDDDEEEESSSGFAGAVCWFEASCAGKEMCSTPLSLS